MMREIGSEFWDIPISTQSNSLFPEKTRWFISGTAALEQILDDILESNPIQTAGIPSWCCSCMITPFLRRMVRVVFYPVWYDEQKGLSVDYNCTEKCDVTLRMSYFGYSFMNAYGKPGGIIIEDLTHSLFCGFRQEATYYYGSLRKWAGFYTGGYSWKNGDWQSPVLQMNPDNDYIMHRKEAMRQKRNYIEGKTASKDYLEIFDQCEKYLDTCGIMPGDPEDTQKAKLLDIKRIKESRRKNAQRILDSFGEYAVFKSITDSDCPLFAPLLFPNPIREELRSFLISRSIYCPVHWPVSEFHKLNETTEKIYQQEISIICDQRYNENDIERIVDEIKHFMT